MKPLVPGYMDPRLQSKDEAHLRPKPIQIVLDVDLAALIGVHNIPPGVELIIRDTASDMADTDDASVVPDPWSPKDEVILTKYTVADNLEPLPYKEIK